jgi:hypothetical protein
MSKSLRSRRDIPSVDDRLTALLDTPHLSRIIPGLAPETLHALIQRRGLESCGALLAAATSAQLTAVLDIDLWRSARNRPTEDFDEDRFGEWLEALAEEGDSVAAGVVSSMDPALVIHGLSHFIRVFDPGALLPPEGDDDDPSPMPGFDPSANIGGYVVQARRPDGWDAIVALLTGLGEYHPRFFTTVMCGCRRLSNSTPEVDGLDNLLAEPQQLLHDVHGEREQRRGVRGYASTGDARAFLAMARRPRHLPPDGPSTNPIADAYFRAADEAAAVAVEKQPGTALAAPATLTPAEADAIAAIVAVLAETDPPQGSRRLLQGDAAVPLQLAPIRPLLEALFDIDPAAFAMRSRELGFLANTLIAGCSVQSRPFTPRESSDAALCICNLGLLQRPALPDTFLVDHDLVCAFETGWAMLHEEVTMFVTGRLLAVLDDLHCADEEVQAELRKLRRELAAEANAGTPWQAQRSLEVIANLDIPAWASLRGLLGECPILPASLTATIEGRKGAISATAFEFFSTPDHLRQVRQFVERLPEMLIG